MKEIYRGLLVAVPNQHDYYALGFVDECYHVVILADVLQLHMRRYGNFLTARYYISDREQSANALQKAFLSQVLGASRADYEVHYSEITGYLRTAETINIGGHNLLEELKTSLGKWLHLEIEYNKGN